ncbi:MAG: peptidylprolyl isomerase [Bacteroidetes bacterium 4572_112]|nr:MAG: peptidylprolyl isomerase [Bacteroidetes bacterium 4572_112]
MIAKNKVVSLHYVLKEGTKEGEVIEETAGQEPMVFLYGVGQMIPKFEDEINGKTKGDKAEFGIKAAEAYGELDESAVITLPIDVFKNEGAVDLEMLKVGNVLPMQDGDGNRMDGIVTDVDEKEVKMDFNHPMAGKDLYFEIEVVEVRDASKEELEHGHVHGEGGVQH